MSAPAIRADRRQIAGMKDHCAVVGGALDRRADQIAICLDRR
jgi:hypothetical protein